MKRLPGCDRSTHRAETAVFGALASVAVVLVSMAVVDAFRFASNREALIAALEQGVFAQPQCVAATGATNCTVTNAPAPQHSSSGGKVPARSTVSAPEE